VIAITHTHEDGTVVDGTRKGDGVGDVLKTTGFRWRYGAWRIQNSRDRMADDWTIQRAAEALRAAGFEVTVEVDNTPRSFAEAEAERVERAEDRAGRFAEYSGNAAGRRDAAQAAVDGIGERFWGGQPVLVGHHSQRRAERDRERMDNGARRAVEEDRKADYWAQRAEAAEHHQERREDVPTTIRRIERLEVERRQIQRRVDSGAGETYRERMAPRIAQLDDEIAHWRRHVEAAKAAGVKVWSREDFAKGDYVRFFGGWHEVLRVNAKSLTIPSLMPLMGPNGAELARKAPYTHTLAYDKVHGRRSAEEVAGTAP
jgi:hypothetical protein